MTETAVRRLNRIGWSLLAAGALCAFSLVFLPSGILAAAAGIVCLVVASVLRHRPKGPVLSGGSRPTED